MSTLQERKNTIKILFRKMNLLPKIYYYNLYFI